jgi:NTF2 fold immunity protein
MSAFDPLRTFDLSRHDRDLRERDAVVWTLLFEAMLAGSANADPRCAGNIDIVQPDHGVIASAITAQEVALAYLKPIYGEQIIAREMPLRATLSGGVWTVVGSPPSARPFVGGLAEIKLCQRNGRVLSVTHYK